MTDILSTLVVEHHSGVAKITLQRPEVLNSFNRIMAQELQAVIAGIAVDPTARCVLLTGAGRAFCAGQDLAEVGPRPDGTMPDLGDIVRECYNPIVQAIYALDKPVVCAVNGIAAGAGSSLALACDIVIAAQTAAFVQSFVKVGLIPDTGGTFILPRLVGTARAVAWAMLGEKVSADQALAAGMIYKVVTSEALADESFLLAKGLATQPTAGIALIKQAFHRSANNSLSEQLALEEELQRAAGRTNDYREGVLSFIEKRPPTFSGT